MTYKMPALPYAKNALEPHLSKEVVEYHYDKHTRKYYDTANELAKDTMYARWDLEDIISKDLIKRVDSKFFNNVTQAFNHTFYWDGMTSSDSVGKPSDELKKAIDEKFGSYDKFVKQFVEKATGLFGSGWCWLVVYTGELQIKTTPNGGCPLTEDGVTLLLACDLWEHAHYLQYPADRAGYIDKWWNVVNWDKVNERYSKVRA